MSTVTIPETAVQPSARTRLIEAAIELLSEHGPSEMKARAIADRAGVSTMGVYSHFGGLPELLRAVADEGFRRQVVAFSSAPMSDDAMYNLYMLALACTDFARSNRHLYDLMFGLAVDGRYNNSRSSPAPAKTPDFEKSFAFPLAQSVRLVETGRIGKVDPVMIAIQFWSGLHGYIMLELGGHFAEIPDSVATILKPLCVNLVAGMGASRDMAELAANHAIADWQSRTQQGLAG